MNIFWLSKKTKRCAQFHLNKHVIKMILEYAQLLSTCWHVVDPSHAIFEPQLRKTHVNHPCSVWVRESSANYAWLSSLAMELCKEYTHRYGKTHKTQAAIERLRANVPVLSKQHLTRPPQAMPDEFKGECVVKAYRNYYIAGKRHIHAWKHREPPPFITAALPALKAAALLDSFS